MEVAELAGVSLGTVSNVLNHPHRVTPVTRKKVQRAIEQLGFTRNTVASALARGDTRTVGLVVVGLSNSLFVESVAGFQNDCAAFTAPLVVIGPLLPISPTGSPSISAQPQIVC